MADTGAPSAHGHVPWVGEDAGTAGGRRESEMLTHKPMPAGHVGPWHMSGTNTRCPECRATCQCGGDGICVRCELIADGVLRP